VKPGTDQSLYSCIIKSGIARFTLIIAIGLVINFSAPTSHATVHDVVDLVTQLPEKIAKLCINAFIPSHMFKPNTKYRTSRMNREFLIIDIAVRYLSAWELAQAEIVFDHKSSQWKFSLSEEPVPKGLYIFVMDPDGKIYILPFGTLDSHHHSSFFRGAPIASGGKLNFTEPGVLTVMDTKTGHYFEGFQPRELMWQQFIAELTERQAKLADLKIIEYQGGMIDDVPPNIFILSESGAPK
jgi:hypothetical protein